MQDLIRAKFSYFIVLSLLSQMACVVLVLYTPSGVGTDVLLLLDKQNGANMPEFLTLCLNFPTGYSGLKYSS
jgi:hypothetical protein